ncbi:dTDP-4-amino-4,6-dideoxygalactose transaminase [Clostridium sp. AUH-JLR23]|uniref:dTDP-4-amino-4,6-dideoxygalactose transaminase n=1 Tax=Clostridium sp. AUH-JLR23 TaxID=1505062 RepID=UPI00356B1411
MIKFNKPTITQLEEKYIVDALHNSILSGDGKYTNRVYQQFQERFGIKNMLLTTSGTTALEMASILADLQDGDEVIAPSFTFSSTINAFLLRGAKAIFCDIREDTFNIDENKIEYLITDKTKAIYVVHYAGIPCEMDKIIEIANKYNLFIIEDAAQAVGSTYKGKVAGTMTEFGCYSFHETKNYAMGEGGAIIVNEEKYMERAEIIREKGTNRRNVLRGLVDKYTWHDIGSSFLPSDLLAALLSAQMDRYDEIMEKRMLVWNTYYEGLQDLEKNKKLRLPIIPEGIQHNAHMFNILLPTAEIRDDLIKKLKEKDIVAYICYVPLHSSPYGLKLGYKPEDCPITEDIASRLLRLPLYADMTKEDATYVVKAIEGVL